MENVLGEACSVIQHQRNIVGKCLVEGATPDLDFTDWLSFSFVEICYCYLSSDMHAL